jgi:hypothetical protein
MKFKEFCCRTVIAVKKSFKKERAEMKTLFESESSYKERP